VISCGEEGVPADVSLQTALEEHECDVDLEQDLVDPLVLGAHFVQDLH